MNILFSIRTSQRPAVSVENISEEEDFNKANIPSSNERIPLLVLVMRYHLKDQLVAANSPKPECEWGLERRAG